MKRDVYMKVILTIIAVCLVWICLRDIPLFSGRLYADQFGSVNSVMDVRLVGYKAPLTPVPVQVENWPAALASPQMPR